MYIVQFLFVTLYCLYITFLFLYYYPIHIEVLFGCRSLWTCKNMEMFNLLLELLTREQAYHYTFDTTIWCHIFSTDSCHSICVFILNELNVFVLLNENERRPINHLLLREHTKNITHFVLYTKMSKKVLHTRIHIFVINISSQRTSKQKKSLCERQHRFAPFKLVNRITQFWYLFIAQAYLQIINKFLCNCMKSLFICEINPIEE